MVDYRTPFVSATQPPNAVAPTITLAEWDEDGEAVQISFSSAIAAYTSISLGSVQWRLSGGQQFRNNLVSGAGGTIIAIDNHEMQAPSIDVSTLVYTPGASRFVGVNDLDVPGTTIALGVL